MKCRTLLITALTFTGCTDAAAPRQPLETGQLSMKAARLAGPTTLPTFGGGGRANAINDAGIVVGVASERNPSRTQAGTSYPAKWVRSEITGSWEVSPLGTAGGQALAVNELGDAVGLLLVITGETNTQTAVVWPAGGGELLLEAGVAEGINDAGIIVGGDRWGGAQVAYVWVPNGDIPRTWTRSELPLLAVGGSAEAIAINEHSEITGAATNAAGLPRAVVWLPVSGGGGWSGPFPRDGTEASTGTSAGFAINDNGDVVGYARPCAFPCNGRPYLWPSAASGGGSFDLGSLNPRVTSGRSTGIAYEGQVVGVVNVTRGNGGGPFLWYPDATTLTDLGNGEVTGINNRTARYGQEAVGYASSRTQNPMVWRVP